jgi:hypothetical protein
VNRIQQFRNIPSRCPGSALEPLLDHKRKSRTEHHARDAAIFRFPSGKGDFWPTTVPFLHRHDQNNFHIFRDLYQRSSLGRFPEEGAFGC